MTSRSQDEKAVPAKEVEDSNMALNSRSDAPCGECPPIVFSQLCSEFTRNLPSAYIVIAAEQEDDTQVR
jgi:hypothetical protein